MKKIILPIIVIVSLFLTMAGTALAKKPEAKPTKAQKVDWNLSGAVMPVPPYGSGDIIGSDTASKLSVKQYEKKDKGKGKDKGKNEIKISGRMKGLTPSTMYTVFVSNPYTPYVCTGWNVAGNWTLSFVVTGGGTYNHDFILSQVSGVISGTAGYPAGGPYNINETVTGTIDVNAGAITMHLTQPGGYYSDMTGSIASNGTIGGGTWTDINGLSGTWLSTDGTAVKNCTGSTGWAGQLIGTSPLTFTTNDKGDGKWHVKLNDGDMTKPFGFSVWINGGGATILISDNVTISK